MTWVRIDDRFPEHPKVAQAGPLAWALHLAALCYCNRNLTDGFIPALVAERLVTWNVEDAPDAVGVRRRWRIGVSGEINGFDVESEMVIGKLLEVGMWERVENGYLIHDFSDYQPTKQEVELLREQRRRAGRKGGFASGRKRLEQANNEANEAKGKQTPSKTGSKRPSKNEAEANPVPVPVLGSSVSSSSSPSSRSDTTPQEREIEDHDPEWGEVEEPEPERVKVERFTEMSSIGSLVGDERRRLSA